ncbi:HAD family hydrolase [Candidatus Leptofilum sp.]|uniref:HAD family hydrolase n=1 Tax=Candidatus Leptofilum sp. TaxID=3241576 RepID=UPI003B5976F2
MTTQQYKAIFFDLDGTLRIPTPSPTDAFIQFARSQKIEIGTTAVRRVKIWAHRYWSQDKLLSQEMNRLGEDNFWINYSRQLLETVDATDNLDKNAKLVREYFGSAYAPEVSLSAGAVELFATLKEAGLTLGVVSNRTHRFDDVLEQLEITDWFDMTLAAGEIGCWKPNTAIFHHARSYFADLAADECVYVGDNYFADGLGASRAGMLPIIYDPDGLYGGSEMVCVDALAKVTVALSQSIHD